MKVRNNTRSANNKNTNNVKRNNPFEYGMGTVTRSKIKVFQDSLKSLTGHKSKDISHKVPWRKDWFAWNMEFTVHLYCKAHLSSLIFLKM